VVLQRKLFYRLLHFVNILVIYLECNCLTILFIFSIEEMIFINNL